MSELKDSGKRQDFPTGSKRDLQDGKGRFDLVMLGWPRALTLLAKHMEKGYKKYGTDPSTGAPEPAWRNNWTRGQPLSRYLDSATRHLTKFCANETDEDHLTAAIWNLLSLLETGRRIEDGLLSKELNDIGREVSDDSRFAIYGGTIPIPNTEIDSMIKNGEYNLDNRFGISKKLINIFQFKVGDLVRFENYLRESVEGYIVKIYDCKTKILVSSEQEKGLRWEVDILKVPVFIVKSNNEILDQLNKGVTTINQTPFGINDLVTFDDDFYGSTKGYIVGIHNKIITVIVTDGECKGMKCKVDTEKVKVSLLK